jgi:hypothetical protein
MPWTEAEERIIVEEHKRTGKRTEGERRRKRSWGRP